MTTEINLGNLVIPIIKPEKGKDYYTETEKQELISIVTDNVNSVVLPQEQTRQENEATRQSNEETRQSQENTRQNNEVSRQTAESARVEAENLRQSNESSRISAEQARVGTFNTQMQAVDTAIAGIHTSQDAYDQNAQNKTEAFNTNATNKMNAYNENASEKIAEYDEHVHDYETELANKVDKVQGKDLSTNDYDNTEKGKVQANTEARHTHSNKSVLDGTTASYTTEKDQKLDGLENYNDTELREDIEQNRTSIEENYKVITKLQEDVEDLTERVEDAENNELTYTPTPATSHYLQDSADARFRKFLPIGRTTQESTTGRNLVYNTLLPRTVAGVTITYDASRDVYKLSGTATANANAYIIDYTVSIASLNSNESIEFYIERVSGTKKVQFMCYFVPDDESAKDYTYYTILNENQTGIVRNVKTPNKSGKVAYVQFYLASGTTYNDEVRIMVSKTLNATYEPYTGGEPAPNPNYPYAIKNTGDNGSVNEKIENKNIFNKSKATNGRYVKNTDGTLGYSDTLSASDFIKVRANVTYYQSNVNNYYSCLYNEDKNFIKQINSNSFTPTVDGYMRTSFLTTNIDIVQIEQNSTPSDYVPHEEQNLSFPLAEGQKFYEGSHPDDDEKVHHKWNQLTITEAMVDKTIITSYSKLDYIRFGTPRKYIGNGKTNTALMSCANENTDWSFDDKKYIGTFTNKIQYNYFYIGIPKGTTYNEIKDKIIGQTLVYKLAEETTEDFTEEQKTAWEQIKKARTYKNVTHISSEDETPANVEIEYVQDTKTYIDNKVTALTNAITSLGGNV